MNWLARRRIERRLRELGRAPTPAPPRGLAERIKAEIPADLTLAGLDEESPEPTPRAGGRWHPHRWRIAAALVMTVAAGTLTWWVRREGGVPEPAAVAERSVPAKTGAAAAVQPEAALPEDVTVSPDTAPEPPAGAPPAGDEVRRDLLLKSEQLRRRQPAGRSPEPPPPTGAAGGGAAPDADRGSALVDRLRAGEAGAEAPAAKTAAPPQPPAPRQVPEPPPSPEPEGRAATRDREFEFREEVDVTAPPPAAGPGSAVGGTASSAAGEPASTPPPGPSRDVAAGADRPQPPLELSARAAAPPATGSEAEASKETARTEPLRRLRAPNAAVSQPEAETPPAMQGDDVAFGTIATQVPAEFVPPAVAFARTALAAGRLPPAGVVRPEDFGAAFTPRAAAGPPAITAAGGPPPIPVPGHPRVRLLTLRLHSGHATPALFEIRFDPSRVPRARRLGLPSDLPSSAGGGSADDRSLAATELARGLTLLYELELSSASTPGPLATVTLRPAGAPTPTLSHTVVSSDLAPTWEAAPPPFRLAAVAAALGTALADPAHTPRATFTTLATLAARLSTVDYPSDPTAADLARLATQAAQAATP